MFFFIFLLILNLNYYLSYNVCAVSVLFPCGCRLSVRKKTHFNGCTKNVSIQSCHISKRIKMTVLCLIFLDQIRLKWIKLDQTWSNCISHQSKNVTIKSCHIYKKDNNGCFILDFLDQIRLNLNLIKLAQIGFFTNQKMLL